MNRIFTVFLLLVLGVLSGSLAQEVLHYPNYDASSGLATIHIACLHTGTGRFSRIGAAYKTVWKMWQNWVHNTIGGISQQMQGYQLQPTVYQVDFTLFEVGASTLDQMSANVVTACNQIVTIGTFDAVIAPYSSTLTEIVPTIIKNITIFAPGAASEQVFECNADDMNDPTLCYNASSVPTTRFPNLYGTLASANDYYDVILNIAKFEGSSTVAFVYENNTFGADTCVAARARAVKLGLKVVGYQMYSGAGSLASLQAAGADFVVGCMYQDTCAAMLQQMSAMGWYPNGTAVSTCVGDPWLLATAGGASTQYVMGPVQWSHLRDDASYTEPPLNVGGFRGINQIYMFPYVARGMTSAEQFRQAYLQASSGVEPTYQAASALACLYALHAGYLRGGRGLPPSQAIPSGLQWFVNYQIGLSTFWGYLGFDASGQMAQSDDFMVLQYDHSYALQLITPLRLASTEILYPAPTQLERVCLASTPGCGVNGACQRDGTCLCSYPYEGTTCSAKINPVVDIMTKGQCQGWWIAAAVLLAIALATLAFVVFCGVSMRHVKAALARAREGVSSVAAAAGVSMGGTGGGGGGEGDVGQHVELEADDEPTK